MSDDNKDKDNDRPIRIADKANDLAEYCRERQIYHSRKSQEYGYSEEIFSTMSSSMRNSPDDPVYSGLEKSIDKFGQFIQQREQEANPLNFDVSSYAYALGAATAASTSMITMVTADPGDWLEELNTPNPPSGWSPSRSVEYSKRLEKLNTELGKQMRSVWQTFYGGSENSERASLAIMRELYNHFFSVIAPDNKVRSSKYFNCKESDKADQIHRKERIRYAANESISDKSLGMALEAQAEYIDSVYTKLNKMHKRGELKRDETLEVLTSMQTILEEWLDALSL